MRKLASATIGVLILSIAGAFSQLITRPDPTPRLPPQAGQGIPVEDRQFISRAANLSEAEMEAGRLAFEKGNSPAIKEFGQRSPRATPSRWSRIRRRRSGGRSCSASGPCRPKASTASS